MNKFSIRSAQIIASLIIAFSAPSYADDAKKMAEEYQQKFEQYKNNAYKLSSFEISQKIQDQISIIRLKKSSLFNIDDDTLKASAYASLLEDRRNKQEPEASFYYGLYESQICGKLEHADSVSAKKCWESVFRSYKIASDNGYGAASFNLAKLYENGYGVLESKFAAADWFVKSAEQFQRSGAREETLTAIEQALRQVSDHPKALKLKKEVLK